METVKGQVVTVTRHVAGSTLIVDAVATDTVLFVDDASAFDEAGGSVSIEGAAPVTYDSVDVDASTITLTSGLAGDLTAYETFIAVSPEAERWTAETLLQDDSGITVPALVPMHLQDAMPEGIRELEEREPVTLLFDGEDWTVYTVDWRPLVRDGSFIDPNSTIPPAALTDGEPPASSPTPTLEQFAVGGLKWSVVPVANADPVKFRVYADTVDPPTVDAAHLVYDGSALSGSFASIDGVALLPSDPSVAPDPVFVAVIEYDADGDAALSATSASAVPRRATASDISADYVYAGTLQANQVEAGTFEADLALIGRLSVGNYTVVDGDTGAITIYADAEHTEPLIQLDPAGSVFRGQIIADDISVLNGLILQGTDSHIAQNAGVTLDNAINDPGTAPSLSLVPETSAWPSVASGYTNRGIAWDGTNWIRLIALATGYTRIQTINTSGVVTAIETLEDAFGASLAVFQSSVVRIGSYWFTTYLDSTNDEWLASRYDLSGVDDGGQDDFASSSAISLSRPCVGTDGTNLLVAYTKNNGDLSVEVRNPLLLGNLSTTYTATGAPTGHHMYVGKGSFDFGADRIVLAVGSTVHVYSISGTTLTEETDETFTLPSSAATGGFAWNDSHFYSTHGSTILNKYPDYYPGASENAYVSYRDTDGTDHTMDSPHASIAMSKRRYVQATLPPAPSGASVPAVYAALATSDPADTALLLRSETITNRNILIDPSVAGGTDLDPDSNTFGAGTPAWVKSQAGGLELNGDGTGAWPLQEVTWTKARKTATQTTATGTGETLGQSGELYGAFDGSGTNGDTAFWTESNGVFIILEDGVYDLEAYVQWASNATGYRVMTIAISTSTVGAGDIRSAVNGQVTRQSASCTLALSAGDTVSVQVLQTSGGNLNVDIGSYLTISRRGALAA